MGRTETSIMTALEGAASHPPVDDGGSRSEQRSALPPPIPPARGRGKARVAHGTMPPPIPTDARARSTAEQDSERAELGGDTLPVARSHPDELEQAWLAGEAESEEVGLEPAHESMTARGEPAHESLAQREEPAHESLAQREEPAHESLAQREEPAHESLAQREEPAHESMQSLAQREEPAHESMPPLTRREEPEAWPWPEEAAAVDVDFGGDDGYEPRDAFAGRAAPLRSRKTWLILAAAFLLGAGVAAVIVAVSGPQVPSPAAPAAVPTVQAPAAAPPPTAAPPATAPTAVVTPLADSSVEEPVAAAQEPPREAVRALFVSEPVGATVTLITDGEPRVLGESPAEAWIAPGHRYEAMFARQGYVSQLLPVVAEGAVAQVIVRMEAEDGSGDSGDLADSAVNGDGSAPSAALEREPSQPDDNSSTAKEPSEERSSSKKRRARRERRERRERRAAAHAPALSASKSGVLMVGAKPPCQIYINGRSTGLTTPQRDISLPQGSHTVTLVNRSHRIKKSFRVSIQPGQKTRIIRDMTDQIR